MRLKASLNQLDGDVDAVSSDGLSGAASVRAQRKPLVIRLERMQAEVATLLRAARGVPPATEADAPEPEPDSSPFLVRTPSKKSNNLDEELEAISLRLEHLQLLVSPACPLHTHNPPCKIHTVYKYMAYLTGRDVYI